MIQVPAHSKTGPRTTKMDCRLSSKLGKALEEPMHYYCYKRYGKQGGCFARADMPGVRGVHLGPKRVACWWRSESSVSTAGTSAFLIPKHFSAEALRVRD